MTSIPLIAASDNTGMRDSPRSALSFLEVMIGVLLCALLFIPVFSMLRQAATGTVQTRDEITAYGYAASILNYARGLSFENAFLKKSSPVSITKLELTDGSVLLEVDPRFVCSLAITDHSPDPKFLPYHYKVLRADVEWTSGGVKRVISLTSMHYGAMK